MMKALARSAALACLLATAAPSAAHASQAAAAEALPEEELALARTAVDFLWPLGTYERMMAGTKDIMIDGIMSAMFDVPVSDIAGLEAEALDPDDAGKTMREVIGESDPHFEDRLRITNNVMLTEMIPLMAQLEPQIRDMLTRSYARKFTAAQLADMNAFFATPSGRAFAAESMMMFVDPELMSVIAEFGPTLMREMPTIMEKVEAATAHLPPPPRPEGGEEPDS